MFIYEYIYSFDTNNFNYHIDISNNDNLSFSITFNNINITSSYETFDPAIEGYNITFYVYAFLYPKNSSCEELVNTSSLVYDRQYLYKSQTKSIYFYDKNISLQFSNISREHNYVYDLVLKINAFVEGNRLNPKLVSNGKDPNSLYIKKNQAILSKSKTGITTYQYDYCGMKPKKKINTRPKV